MFLLANLTFPHLPLPRGAISGLLHFSFTCLSEKRHKWQDIHLSEVTFLCLHVSPKRFGYWQEARGCGASGEGEGGQPHFVIFIPLLPADAAEGRHWCWSFVRVRNNRSRRCLWTTLNSYGLLLANGSHFRASEATFPASSQQNTARRSETTLFTFIITHTLTFDLTPMRTSKSLTW